MENNQNTDNSNFNLGSDNASFNLMKTSMPDWLQSFFRTPNVYNLSDINENIIDGYPTDDEF